MKTTLFVAIMFTLVLTAPLFAGDREKLTADLRDLRNRIEKLESADRIVPDGLREAEGSLEEALAELEELEFVGDKAIDMMERTSRTQAQRLRDLRKHDENAFRELLGELMPWLEEMEELRVADPELYELERKSHEFLFECEHLAGLVREAEPKDREHLKEKLRQQLVKLFKIRLETKRLEVKRLESELCEIRKQIENMSSKQDAMIERRLSQMLSTDEGW